MYKKASYLLFSYEGRIRRREFWLGLLLACALTIALTGTGLALDLLLHAPTFPSNGLGPYNGQGPLYFLLSLPAIYCTYAVWVKRLHDRNKRAFWLLLQVIPIVGTIWLFVEAGLFPGTMGPNDWGDDPWTRALTPPASANRPPSA